MVLDLGCGLDQLMICCKPPSSIDWYDIDFPVVVLHNPAGLLNKRDPEVPRLEVLSIERVCELEVLSIDRP